MKNILHIGLEGSSNLGDVAITKVIRKLISEKYNISTLSFNFKVGNSIRIEKKKSLYLFLKKNIFVKSFYDLIFIPLRNYKHFVQSYKKIKEADKILIGGGNILMGYDLVFPVQAYIYTKIAKWLKKEIVFYLVGYGPFNVPMSKIIIDCAIKKSTKIIFRDTKSKYDFLKENKNFNSKVSVINDPVLAYKSICDKSSTEVDENCKFEILISVLPFQHPAIFPNGTYEKYSAYINDMSNLINELQSKYSVALIATDFKQDNLAIKDLKIDKKNVSIIELGSVDDFSNIVKQSKLVISTRMHSAIMGLAYLKPVIALSWQKKIDGLFSDLGLNPYLININNINQIDKIQTLLDSFLIDSNNVFSYQNLLNKQLKDVERKLLDSL